MSLKNLLDLRKKDIQIIERIIFKKRPFHKEIFLTLAVILTASGVIWGISRADNNIENRQVTDKGFSAIGIVSNITETEISIVDAKGTNKELNSYTLSTLSVNKIETKDYQPLTLLDIKVGDRVILQGRQTKEGDVIIGRIISFGIAPLIAKEETATSTATTTATTTESASSTTQASSTEQATSSPSIIQTIKDVVSGTISDIVNAIITGSTGTSTEPIATTTEPTATTTDTITPEATTTEEAPTPPAPAPEPVPTPKVDEPAPEEKAPAEPTTPQTPEQQEALPTPSAPSVTELTN